jgi:hypothetical protein
VDARQHADLDPDRPDLVEAPAVEPLAPLEEIFFASERRSISPSGIEATSSASTTSTCP